MTEQCRRGVSSLPAFCAADMPLHLAMKVAFDHNEVWCSLYQRDIFFPFFGASELLPLCLNLAVVRFNLNGYLDSLVFFGKLMLCMAESSHKA